MAHILIVKVYRVILDDGHEKEVIADSYMAVDGSFVFYANAQPVPDVFFREDSVMGINVLTNNADDLYRWRR